MKKKIIFVQFTKFLDFHYYLYEIDYLEKFFDIELHDLSYIFNKNIHKKYNYLKNTRNIINFYSFKIWIKKIFIEQNKYKEKLFLFYNGTPLNFKFLYYHMLILVKKINIIEIEFIVMPKVNIYEEYSFAENLKYKLHRLTKRFNHVIYDFKSKIIKKIIILTYKFFPPKYFLCCGKINYNNLKKKFPKTKIVSLNSWECSKIYIKNKNYKKIKTKYGVYLSSFSEKSSSDSIFYKYEKLEKPKNVFFEVNIFLETIEKFSKNKVYIALHPRSEIYKKFKPLNNRLSFYDKKDFLIKNSKFVITHMSVASAYAVLFNKPLIFITTKEHKKNLYFLRYSKKMSQYLGSTYIDLNNKRHFLLDNKVFKVNKNKYRYFIKNYLTSKSYSQASNSKILEKVINSQI